MTEDEARHIWNDKKNKAFMLGMYTERWIKKCQLNSKEPMTIHKDKFDGLIPIKYFERHAKSLSKGMEIFFENDRIVRLRVLNRPKLSLVMGDTSDEHS